MKRNKLGRKIVCLYAIISFLANAIFPATLSAADLGLPAPNQFVHLSEAYSFPALKGVKIYPDDPLKFDFLLEEGDAKLTEDELKKESELLIKYFLAALTLPEQDLWVNLSPFEQDKIIPDETSQTEMGKGLLEQDYLLKQLVASLLYPETDLGKEFWQKVYTLAYQRFGTTKIPVNTFNKVWIVPDKAVVYEDGERALIEESKLKVMLETDYLAFKNRNQRQENSIQRPLGEKEQEDVNDLSSQVMQEVVIPALEEEVNSGKNFTTLRKMYRSFILASWFKKRLKESLLGQVYVDQKKTKGIDIDEPQLKERVYQQYLQSYKDGLYNYIKTDYSPQERKHIKRKYWSGGVSFNLGINTSSGFSGAASSSLQMFRIPSLVENGWQGPELTVAASPISSSSPLAKKGTGLRKELTVQEKKIIIEYVGKNLQPPTIFYDEEEGLTSVRHLDERWQEKVINTFQKYVEMKTDLTKAGKELISLISLPKNTSAAGMLIGLSLGIEYNLGYGLTKKLVQYFSLFGRSELRKEEKKGLWWPGTKESQQSLEKSISSARGILVRKITEIYPNDLERIIKQGEQLMSASSSPLEQEGAGSLARIDPKLLNKLPEEIRTHIPTFIQYVGGVERLEEVDKALKEEDGIPIGVPDLHNYMLEYLVFVRKRLGSYLKSGRVEVENRIVYELTEEDKPKIAEILKQLEDMLKRLQQAILDEDSGFSSKSTEKPPDPTKDYWGYRKWLEDKKSKEDEEANEESLRRFEDWLNTSSPIQPQTPGGIDLNDAFLELATSGKGFQGYNPETLKAISANVAGFEPKIISIKKY